MTNILKFYINNIYVHICEAKFTMVKRSDGLIPESKNIDSTAAPTPQEQPKKKPKNDKLAMGTNKNSPADDTKSDTESVKPKEQQETLIKAAKDHKPFVEKCV